jgi:hypothetical protein
MEAGGNLCNEAGDITSVSVGHDDRLDCFFGSTPTMMHHATIQEMNVESYRRKAALKRKRGPSPIQSFRKML